MERELAPTYKVKAFRQAASVMEALEPDKRADLIKRGAVKTLKGIGDATATVITEAASGKTPARLVELEKNLQPPPEESNALRSALRGDCHTHSTWSDGGSSILEMARTARELNHEYIVLTDHSPRLTVANGLTPERLRSQFEELKLVNAVLAADAEAGAPKLQVLRGIEVDVLDDGALDQEPDLLDELDLVVASVHSKLKMDSVSMTKRMIAAVENPRTNVLGHCTGRLNGEKKRAQSTFDAAAVFAACVANDVAVEINSRPERRDPPMALLELASEMGCSFVIDTDAHAPGQLDWQWIGCERAARVGITAERIKNTQGADELKVWASRG